MKDLIFKYLDKKNIISGDTLFAPENPLIDWVNNMFGLSKLDASQIINNWIYKRLGDSYKLVYANGEENWWHLGKLHRDNDLPAIVNVNGTEEWFKEGLKHRDNDMPAVVHPNGTKEWWQNNKRHRIGGPATIVVHGFDLYTNEPDISQEWRVNGELHRKDGPAVICRDGEQRYYLNNVRVDKTGSPFMIRGRRFDENGNLV